MTEETNGAKNKGSRSSRSSNGALRAVGLPLPGRPVQFAGFAREAASHLIFQVIRLSSHLPLMGRTGRLALGTRAASLVQCPAEWKRSSRLTAAMVLATLPTGGSTDACTRRSNGYATIAARSARRRGGRAGARRAVRE